MPKPIVCLSDQLRQFLAVFRTSFSKRQWKYFVIVLLALIECEQRRTMTGLLRTIGERVSLSGFSRFLSKWPWSPEQVAQTWLQRFRRAAQARGWDVSGGFKSNRTLRLIADDGSRTWQPLSQYAAQLSADDWQEVVWPSE